MNTTRHLTAAALAAFVLAGASQAAAQANQGETLFKQQCGTCHAIAPGGAAKMGPPLKGMVGRKAGTVAGFAYSPALKASGITWSADSLDKYIAKPTVVVPGTKMMVGAADATKRAAIVAYLVAQK